MHLHWKLGIAPICRMDPDRSGIISYLLMAGIDSHIEWFLCTIGCNYPYAVGEFQPGRAVGGGFPGQLGATRVAD